MAPDLSEQDRRILRLLQRDARLSNQEVADRTGMSASACWRRVKALEADRVISGYVAEVDAERAGLGFGAIVQIRLERHERAQVDAFIGAVSQRPEVLDLLSTTGDADYHMRVICRDKDSYTAFLEDFLLRLPGILQVRTNLILKEIKSSSLLPL